MPRYYTTIPKRVRIMFLPESFLVQFLNGEVWVRIKPALPKDARVDGLNYCYERKSLALYVYSEEFEPIAEGRMIPAIDLHIEVQTYSPMDEVRQELGEVEIGHVQTNTTD